MEYYDIYVDDGDIDNDESLSELVKDLEKFNVELCWQLLCDSRIVFDLPYLEKCMSSMFNED